MIGAGDSRHAHSGRFAGHPGSQDSSLSALSTSSVLTASRDISGWQWLFSIRRTHSGGLTLDDSKGDDAPTVRSLKMARLEAVLLVADGALAARKLATLATLADAAEARELITRLNVAYDRVGCAFRVEQVAAGYRLMTRPQFAMWLDRLHNRQARAKLSPPMLETLSIVAYRQPLTRAEVEKVRGVQSSEMLKQLMERGFVRITGEEDSLGRPYLYGTTRLFLEEYGLGSLDDLPMSEALRRRPEEDDASITGDDEASGDDEVAGDEAPASSDETAGRSDDLPGREDADSEDADSEDADSEDADDAEDDDDYDGEWDEDVDEAA